jgi:hypothetical protein
MLALRVPSVVVAGAVVGAALSIAVAASGPVAGLLPLLAVVAVGLATRPLWALAAVVGVNVLFEQDNESLVPGGTWFHDRLAALPLSPTGLLLGLFAAAVVVDVGRRRDTWRLPGELTFPLLLLAVAAGAGAVVGLAGGGASDGVVTGARNIGYLVAMPFLVVNTVRDERLARRLLVGGAVLATLKGIEGIATWAFEAGPSLEGATITFLDPTPNLLMMLFLLGVLALAVSGSKVARLLPSTAVVLVAFVLSYRRSFWVAAVVAGLIAIVVASGRHGRVRLVPWIAVAAGLAVMLATGLVGDVRGPVVERVSSLSPAKLRATSNDRYRLDEARNVIAEIRDSPVTGLGFGRPWAARYPLPEEHASGRDYTHVVALWFWLKTGLLGVAAYVWLMAAAVAASFHLARRSAAPSIRAAGIAVGAGLIGLVLAETTGAFTGVDARFDIFLGAVLGWLAAARQHGLVGLARRPGYPAAARRDARRSA